MCLLDKDNESYVYDGFHGLNNYFVDFMGRGFIIEINSVLQPTGTEVL